MDNAAATDPQTGARHHHTGGGTPVHDLSSLGKAKKVGKPQILHVQPGRGLRIAVPHVGTIVGSPGTFSRPGLIRIQRLQGHLQGVQAAGFGVDVAIHHTTLRKPLTITQNVGKAPPGTIPVFAHQRKNGDWELKPARLDSHGRIIIKTRRFSPNLPSFFNPSAWAHAVGDFAAGFLFGRTSPVTCPSAAPQWFTVTNLTVSAHACGQNNPAADGGPRAEVRIKNNRGAVQQVDLAGPRDFVYVQGQPDLLRKAIGALTGTDPNTTVFLSPGDGGSMSVGYRQPTTHQTFTNTVQTTYTSLFLDYAYIAINFLADDASDQVKWLATIRVAQKCTGTYDLLNGTVEDPKTALSSTEFADVFACVLSAGAEELDDPQKALNTALSLVDGKLPGYTTEQVTAELTKIGSRLKAVGRIFKVLNLLPILQQNIQGAIDAAASLLTGGSSTHIDVDLQAPTVTPPPPPPPGSTAVRPYDNYGSANAGHAMCRGNPAVASSMPGGTARQAFVVPNGVARINSATIQIDPDSRVTAHLDIYVNGNLRASTAAAAAGDTNFSWTDVAVSPGDTVTLSLSFTASYGSIITVYTAGNPGGQFQASNSCPAGAPNYSAAGTGLRAVVNGYS